MCVFISLSVWKWKSKRWALDPCASGTMTWVGGGSDWLPRSKLRWIFKDLCGGPGWYSPKQVLGRVRNLAGAGHKRGRSKRESKRALCEPYCCSLTVGTWSCSFPLLATHVFTIKRLGGKFATHMSISYNFSCTPAPVSLWSCPLDVCLAFF